MNKFRTLPLLLTIAYLVSAQQHPAHPIQGCHSGQYRFKGTVLRGQMFSRNFDGLVFALIPNEYGWDIDISQGTQHQLASLTGPQHFVPRSTEIEGWHFRNAANTGPNEGDVNAPDETRRFVFSPRWPHCKDAAGLEKDGEGVLEITDMELGNLAKGAKAFVVQMDFSVVLTIRQSACTACPVATR